jgi:hypothetical protein
MVGRARALRTSGRSRRTSGCARTRGRPASGAPQPFQPRGLRAAPGGGFWAETVAGLGDAELADLAHFLAFFPARSNPR